jgi:hypothetical protein
MLRFTLFPVLAALAVGCNVAPQVSPGECANICEPYGVCEYKDDNDNSQGFCLCKNKNNACPPSDAGTAPSP